MNKTFPIALLLTLIMAAYSGITIADEVNCEEAPAKAPKCYGEPKAPKVTLNLQSMKANPQCVRAHPGTILVFKLTPNNDLQLNTVKIRPKDPSDFWLKGENDVYDDLIILRVPGIHDPDGPDGATDHYYRIETPTKCLDPRIKVEN
ncbi:MAG: hypothetical protein ACR2RD_12005 [Woeseiaceae bacterium]